MAAIALRSHRAVSRLLKNYPALVGSLAFSGSHDVAPSLESSRELLNRNNAAVAAAGFAVVPFSMRTFAAVASDEDIVHVEEERATTTTQGEDTSQGEDAALALFSSADSLVNVTGEDALKYITFR